MPKEQISLQDKIEHTLQEARVILPGTEALLGFQLVSFFSMGEQFSQVLKYAHLTSFGFILLSTIFLLSPVAYHRIAERGHETKRFYLYSATMLILAMVSLAIGLSIDVFVAVALVSQSDVWALVSAVLLFLLMSGLWFGYTLIKRNGK